ncbi:hypothetical protein SNE40_008666 [Patella caerulea]|uniref:BPTI/Kunitz inhibitor domain-containing protein n=1 Tax=Patella caerulea TaxID=87958 RepID=A0AAN8PNY3_PATCE
MFNGYIILSIALLISQISMSLGQKQKCKDGQVYYVKDSDSGMKHQICIPSQCLEERVKGPCRARHIRWLYNTSSKQCEKFIYGGCKGNQNRFRTKKECEETCILEGQY